MRAAKHFRPPRGEFSSPQSIETCHAEREKRPQIKGILAECIKVKVVKPILHGAHALPSWGAAIYVIAEIQDGQFRGTQPDICDASLALDDGEKLELQKPNPAILRLLN